MAWLSLLSLAIDLVLALTLLWLAWRALNSPDLFRAVVLFIALGLVLGLVWVRLDAVDIALAEIALGAGVTGALLLAALAKLQPAGVESPTAAEAAGASAEPAPRSMPTEGEAGDEASLKAPGAVRGLIALLLLVPLLGLGMVVWQLWVPTPGLTELVDARLGESGVAYPVTAVLLNFRGYDTLLELAVLLLALIGVWSLAPASHLDNAEPEPALAALSRLLAPLMILVAAYLVWVGAHAPGGAFQAGSVLGAAGVLLHLSGWQLSPRAIGWPLRLVLVLGVAVFALIGLAVMGFGQPLLGYPLGWAKPAILTIELAATLSIGAILAALFIGGRP
jgi:multisubunit Na+/H+ antiporter MnhB subunit